MNRLSKILFSGVISLMVLPISVLALPKENLVDNKAPMKENITKITYKGNTELNSNIEEKNTKYNSTTAGENSILISGGTVSLINPQVNKSGDSNGDAADFYGTNAAILVYNGAKANISGGEINTKGLHANAVFSYGKGTLNIDNANINTSENFSGGLMVAGGGTLTANNVTVKTKGNSSASIRSDKGGGELLVNGGSFETSGVGSPTIYSTANIVVNKATLISKASEGVVIEGKNSVTLNNVVLTDTNNKLNGNSETYKNIFMYQSMSGDATSGTSTFLAKNSTITTNKGDTIFVTNTSAVIALDNNVLVNNDGEFLRIQKGKWGTNGQNGGQVKLNCYRQKIKGDIIVDDISTLEAIFKSKSLFKGSIDKDNKAKKIDLTLSKDSIIVLTGNSYVDSLTNELKDNSNIYLNGYKLYVNGKEVSGNTGKYDESAITEETDTTNEESNVVSNDISNKESNNNKKTTSNKSTEVYCLCGSLALILIAAIVIVSKSKKD